MSPESSKALYATEDAQFVIRDHLHYKSIAPDRMSVANHYLGVNPSDIRQTTLLRTKSTVLVYGFADRVLKAPPVSYFKKVDIVAGYIPSSLG